LTSDLKFGEPIPDYVQLHMQEDGAIAESFNNVD